MLERDADIVIIGSGAGGGTVARELAPLCADGVRVLVLEAGPKLRPEEFTGREVEMARRLYTDEGGFLTEDRSMSIAFGRAYGGSTVVYTGTSPTITEPTVKRWGVAGLAHADLIERSRKYLAQNRVVVQHAAECISGIVIHQLARPEAPIVWGGAPAIFDMRKGTTPMGAMETPMIDAS